MDLGVEKHACISPREDRVPLTQGLELGCPGQQQNNGQYDGCNDLEIPASHRRRKGRREYGRRSAFAPPVMLFSYPILSPLRNRTACLTETRRVFNWRDFKIL